MSEEERKYWDVKIEAAKAELGYWTLRGQLLENGDDRAI